MENNKPRAKITQKEFDRIIKAYGGDNDIRKHQLQINASKRSNECRVWYEGAILKHLRKRSDLDLKAAAKLIGIYLGYLSNLENSHKPIDTELRKKILCAYRYKKSSYRNYINKKSRLSSISVETRMRSLINNLNTEKLEMVFQYASELEMLSESKNVIKKIIKRWIDRRLGRHHTRSISLKACLIITERKK